MIAAGDSCRQPRLLYLVTEDWYFWSHRLPMARAARDAGFDVSVATRVSEHRARIESEGFRVHPLRWQRRALGPLAGVSAVREIAALYRRERPDVVHHVALKPTVLGGLAAAAAGVPRVVNALTGLGSAFLGRSARSRVAGVVVQPVLRHILNRAGNVLVVQNDDDRQWLMTTGLVPASQIHLIRGSGIDTAWFSVLPEPVGLPITAAFVGRLLEDKGVRVLVQAQQRARREGHDIRLILAGTTDPENPTSISDVEVAKWRALPGVELPGHVEDVRTVWSRAHFAVLPSRREGLPKSLLEAAACGRALLATNVPGCREIARDGENALLVPADDELALASAIVRLASDAALRQRLGAASRRLVESDLAADRIGARTVELYRTLLGATNGAGELWNFAQ